MKVTIQTLTEDKKRMKMKLILFWKLSLDRLQIMCYNFYSLGH